VNLNVVFSMCACGMRKTAGAESRGGRNEESQAEEVQDKEKL